MEVPHRVGKLSERPYLSLFFIYNNYNKLQYHSERANQATIF